MANYSYNIVSKPVPNGIARVQFLRANPSRVSLLVSGEGFFSTRIATRGGSGSDGFWYVVNTQSGTPLTYQDYGPLIQDEVWLSHNETSSKTLIATEIVRLLGC